MLGSVAGTRRQGLARRGFWVVFGLVALYTLRQFGAGVWRGGFVGPEDTVQLTANPYLVLERSHPPGWLWAQPYRDRYVPVTGTFWRAVETLSSHQRDADGALVLTAAPLHAASLALHLACVVLLYALLRRLRLSVPGAAFGALLFACHPLQVEAVSWASAAGYLLAATLLLSALHLSLAAQRWPSGELGLRRFGLLLLATGAGLLAMLAQIEAAVFPLLALVVARHERQADASARGIGAAFPRLWLGLGALVLAVAKWVQSSPRLALPLPLWWRPFVGFEALGFYLQKLLMPQALAPDYPPPVSLGTMGAWPPVLPAAWPGMLLVVLGLVALSSYRPLKPWRLPLLFAVLSLLPALILASAKGQSLPPLSDRYTYVALLGIAWAAATAWDRVIAARPYGPWLAAGILAALAYLAGEQAALWQQPARLYAHTLEVNPTSWWAEESIGRSLVASGQPAAALPHLQLAVALSPRRGASQRQLGLVAAQLGQRVPALAALHAATAADPRDAASYLALANTEAAFGDEPAAERDWRRAVALTEDAAPAALALGSYLAAHSRDSEAADFLHHAAQLRPEDPHLHAVYGDLLLRLGRSSEAVRSYRDALRGGDSSPELLAKLGLALLKRGDYAEAERPLLEALAQKPELSEARASLLQVYEHLGKTSAAARQPALQPN